MGGDYWWRIFDDGQPWYGPVHRAEIAGGAGGLFLNLAGGIFGVFTAVILTAYFIIDGEVEIRLQSREAYLGPGQFFGEVALLTGAPRNATVVAAQPCTLLSLDIVDFHELLGRHPELARIIHEEAQQRPGDVAAPLSEPALAIDESA